MAFIFWTVGGGTFATQPLADQEGRVLSLYSFGWGTGSVAKTKLSRDEVFHAGNNVGAKTLTIADPQTNLYPGAVTPSTAVKTHVIAYHSDFNCVAWRAHPRYPIIQHCDPGQFNPVNVGQFWYSGSVSMHVGILFQEVPEPKQRVPRRSRKAGVFHIYGNSSIRNHQKSGKGAYSQHAPQFVNDITWQGDWSCYQGHTSAIDLDTLGL